MCSAKFAKIRNPSVNDSAWTRQVSKSTMLLRIKMAEASYLFRFLMLSACGLLMYCSTICFHRRRHSQPLKKLCTFLILRSSTDSSWVRWGAAPVEVVGMDGSVEESAAASSSLLTLSAEFWADGIGRHSFFSAHNCLKRQNSLYTYSCIVITN